MAHVVNFFAKVDHKIFYLLLWHTFHGGKSNGNHSRILRKPWPRSFINAVLSWRWNLDICFWDFYWWIFFFFQGKQPGCMPMLHNGPNFCFWLIYWWSDLWERKWPTYRAIPTNSLCDSMVQKWVQMGLKWLGAKVLCPTTMAEYIVNWSEMHKNNYIWEQPPPQNTSTFLQTDCK